MKANKFAAKGPSQFKLFLRHLATSSKAMWPLREVNKALISLAFDKLSNEYLVDIATNFRINKSLSVDEINTIRDLEKERNHGSS